MENPNPASLASTPANAYTGVALLGWMERDHAIRFLTEDCIFADPLTPAAAESLWREWRNRAAALSEREAPAPEQIPLTQSENAHAARFLQFLSGMGVAGVQVIKIDPMQLIVGQYYIAIDVATTHSDRCKHDSDWMERTLPTSSNNPPLNMNFTRRNMDTEVVIDLPHAEFIFGVHPHGGFGPKELLGYVMVMKAGNRMLLAKGYHRLYGRLSTTSGNSPERFCLVAVDPNTLSAASRQAPDTSGLDIFGSRPALFSDFFTEGLAMPVHLRRKRYQLQIQAKWIALNE